MVLKQIKQIFFIGLFFVFSCEAEKNKILVAYEKSNYSKVTELLHLCGKLDTTNYDVLYAIGDSFYKLEKYDSSKKYFFMAKELNNEDKMLFFKLGKSEYLTDGTGFSWFSVALSIDDSFEDAWYYWGLSLVELGNYENAIKGFEKVIDLDPNHHHCYQQLSLCYYLVDKPLEAIKSIDKAIEMKDSSYYFYQKAVISDYLGRYSESLALCDSSLVRDSLHVQSIVLKAQNLINLNQIEEGCKWARKVKQIAPEKDMSQYSRFCN